MAGVWAVVVDDIADDLDLGLGNQDSSPVGQKRSAVMSSSGVVGKVDSKRDRRVVDWTSQSPWRPWLG